MRENFFSLNVVQLYVKLRTLRGSGIVHLELSWPDVAALAHEHTGSCAVVTSLYCLVGKVHFNYGPGCSSHGEVSDRSMEGLDSLCYRCQGLGALRTPAAPSVVLQKSFGKCLIWNFPFCPAPPPLPVICHHRENEKCWDSWNPGAGAFLTIRKRERHWTSNRKSNSFPLTDSPLSTSRLAVNVMIRVSLCDHLRVLLLQIISKVMQVKTFLCIISKR